MNKATSSLWPVLLGAALLLTLTGTLHAAPTEQQWQKVNHTLVEEHIIPRYQQLKDSSAALATSTAELCHSPDQTHLDAAREQFHHTMDAWQTIQHIQFGPIENLMRNFSMQFWPDKKNLIGKQLGILLQQQDPQILNTDALYKASIGVKGLPAMERLLFTRDLSEFENNSYHCQLNNAIAAYIAENSSATLSEWQQEFRESVSNAGDDESYYETHQEAAVDMMKSLVEPLELIRDQKILRPLGDDQKVRPRRSESWRSARSLRNIQLNIATLQHLFSGTTNSVDNLLREQGGTTQADTITMLFERIRAELQTLPSPLHDSLYQQKTVLQLQQISTDLKQLDSEFNATMQILDIQLGFNSRDGD